MSQRRSELARASQATLALTHPQKPCHGPKTNLAEASSAPNSQGDCNESPDFL